MKVLHLICVLSLILSITATPKVQADPMREFLVSSAYGVLAGSLVGAATLALSENPNDNYNNIAKGASLGLYGGMLMGAYLVFVVPGGGSSRAGIEYPGFSEPMVPRLAVIPQFQQEQGRVTKLDGLALNWQVSRF